MKNKNKKENETFLKFLYTTAPGRVILKLLVSEYISELAGAVLDSYASKAFINSFIERNGIDLSEYKKADYRSFNDFFIRQIKENCRPFPKNAFDLPAPCDGKLSAYRITGDSLFNIKNSVYNIKDLLRDKQLADEFNGGFCLIFRLTPDDYHRYSFIDDGVITAYRRIGGTLHTVRPIAHSRYKVYAQNAREYTVMRTRNFGKVIQMEVGALLVGKISNRKKKGAFYRGEEKGMFEFGGSTVIMLFQKDAVSLDETILAHTKAGKETVVKLGEVLGKAN